MQEMNILRYSLWLTVRLETQKQEQEDHRYTCKKLIYWDTASSYSALGDAETRTGGPQIDKLEINILGHSL